VLLLNNWKDGSCRKQNKLIKKTYRTHININQREYTFLISPKNMQSNGSISSKLKRGR
jgi:hypothetical protein